jgi:hypothetical protein
MRRSVGGAEDMWREMSSIVRFESASRSAKMKSYDGPLQCERIETAARTPSMTIDGNERI